MFLIFVYILRQKLFYILRQKLFYILRQKLFSHPLDDASMSKTISSSWKHSLADKTVKTRETTSKRLSIKGVGVVFAKKKQHHAKNRYVVALICLEKSLSN
jgi:hypothetical protein